MLAGEVPGLTGLRTRGTPDSPRPVSAETFATWPDSRETPPLGTCARWPVGRSAPGRACDDLRLVGLKLIFLIVTRAVSLLGLSQREARWKNAEILILRHQLAVALQDTSNVFNSSPR
jgi:hypothetical protein